MYCKFWYFLQIKICAQHKRFKCFLILIADNINDFYKNYTTFSTVRPPATLLFLTFVYCLTLRRTAIHWSRFVCDYLLNNFTFMHVCEWFSSIYLAFALVYWNYYDAYLPLLQFVALYCEYLLYFLSIK